MPINLNELLWDIQSKNEWMNIIVSAWMCALERRGKRNDHDWRLRIEWLILARDNMSTCCERHEECELTHAIVEMRTECQRGWQKKQICWVQC